MRAKNAHARHARHTRPRGTHSPAYCPAPPHTTGRVRKLLHITLTTQASSWRLFKVKLLWVAGILAALIAWCFQSQLLPIREQHDLINDVMNDVRHERAVRGLDVEA